MTFSSTGLPAAWWQMKTEEGRARELVSYLKAIEQDQAARRILWVQYARAYQNQRPDNFAASLLSGAAAATGTPPWSSRNVIKSCVDAAVSKIGSKKPRPLFLTEDGNYKLQQRAKKMTQVVDGQFDAIKIYSKALTVFRDAGVFGIGGLKFTVDTDAGTVCCERVVPDEILVDDTDAVYGTPSQLHHTKVVSRTALKAKFPNKAAMIDKATGAFRPVPTAGRQADLVKVYETYKLPSKPGAGDGKKILALDSGMLDECEWEKDYFPFVFFRWSERISGFWGMGIAEELYGTQLEIQQLLRNIALAQRLVAVPRVFVRPGSMPTSKIDNNIGAIVTTDTPPTFQTPTAMQQEVYNHLKWLVQSAYEQIGISELSAAGLKPAGLDSGEAIRQYEDSVSERFLSVGEKWDQFFLDCAKIVIDLNKDLMALGRSPKVKVQDRDFLETIDWKEVDLDDDKYVLRCFSTNILPTTPGGKLARVTEMIQAGFIPQEEGLKLLDFPDLKAYRNKVLASADLTDKMIDSCLDGHYMAPEPAMDLVAARSTAQMRFLEAKLNGVPARGLSTLSRWIEAINGMLPADPVVVNPQAPDAPGPTDPTLAVPEAPPSNPMIPFA